MDVLSGIFIILAIILLIVFIGFLITFLIGLIGKYKTTKKVGFIGLIISGGSALVFGLCGFGADAIYTHNQEQEQAEQEKHFDEYSKKFKKLYIEMGPETESISKYIADKWEDEIDKSSDNDEDFDVDSTIEKATENKAYEIYKLNSENKELKKQYDLLTGFAPDKQTLQEYKSAYNDLEDFVNHVTSPSGNYESYVDEHNSLDTKVGKHIKEFQQ